MSDISPREVVAAAASAIAFATLFCWRIIANLNFPDVANDWDLYFNALWIARRSIVHYYQLPLWNPYDCGGVALLADPLSHVLTPFLPLTLIFGPFVGLHLEMPLHLAIGWAGAYLLARLAGTGRIGAVCAACAFCSSSWFFLRAAAGHLVFLPIAYTPLVAAAAWLGATRHRIGWSIAAAALIAISFGEGGAYAASYELVVVALLMLPLAMMQQSLWPILTLAIAVIFAAGLAAIKLLPSIAFYDRYPRPIDTAYFASLWELADALFSRNQDLYRPGPNWGFWEYGAYIGVFAVPAIVGLARPRRAFPWAFAALMLFLLARGEISPHAPWTMLHRLPGFHSERMPWRMLMPFVLMVSVLAGLGIDSVIECAPRSGPIVGAALIAAGTIDGFIVGTPNLRHVLENPIGKIESGPSFRQYRAPFYYNDMLKTALANEGMITCYQYTEIPSPTGVIGYNKTGYRGEHYFLGGGSVRLLFWSPNVLSYEASAPFPDLLIINQNYDPAWKLVRGTGTVIAYKGLLAIEVPVGAQRLQLKYIDSRFTLGAVITLLTIVISIIIFRYERRKA